jgi:hypothetical protein
MPSAAKKPRYSTTPILHGGQLSYEQIKKLAATQEVVYPQPGPQTMFLKCQARLVFYGGAAGGG